MNSGSVVHVIDDDDDVRRAVAFFLISSEFAVRAHNSATEFLAALSSLQPGCVICDVRMPGIEPEVARQLIDAAHRTCPYSKAIKGNIDAVVKLA